MNTEHVLPNFASGSIEIMMELQPTDEAWFYGQWIATPTRSIEVRADVRWRDYFKRGQHIILDYESGGRYYRLDGVARYMRLGVLRMEGHVEQAVPPKVH